MFISANLTAFEERHWTTLRAAAGRPGCVALLQQLLAAGADASKAEDFVDEAVRRAHGSTLANSTVARRWKPHSPRPIQVFDSS